MYPSLENAVLGPSAAARALRDRFTGRVLLPGTDGYDAARRTENPEFDQRPALVAEAADPHDVRVAVEVARAHGLRLAVQATGHGVWQPADGALLLSTAALTQVLVDPHRRVARVGAGARWREVIAAAARYGLVGLAGSSADVGVTGYTLGGGLGWLSRRHGFAADSLVEAELVTPDGRLVTASADRNPELFWALRGGGGNFGVVTALEFRLYPVGGVYGGTAYFPLERSNAVLDRFRDWAPGQPDELTTVVLLLSAAATAGLPEPVRGRPVVAVRGVYLGEAAAAERALRPLREAAGPALLDGFDARGIPQLSTTGGIAPLHLELFRELPDAALAAMTGTVPGTDVAAVEVRYWGGAMARPAADAGPVGHRDAPWSVIVDSPTGTLADALRPHATGGGFRNFLRDPGRVAAAYTAADHRRLLAVKRAHDPDGLLVAAL